MSLCDACLKKIKSFYKFKALSLKNDAYLKSLDSASQSVDQKQCVYVDANGIKHEYTLESDECGPSLVEESNNTIKEEINIKYEYTLGSDVDEASFGDEEVDCRNVTLSNEEMDVMDEQTLCYKKLGEQAITLAQPIVQKKSKENRSICVKQRRTKKKKVVKENKVKQMRQVCEECGKSVLNLKEHLLQHQPKAERQTLQCKVCPKTFITAHGRSTHYRITHLGKKSKCDICNKEVIHLKAHKMQVHNKDKLRYPCVQCGRRFMAQSVLDMHMTSHTQDLPFECDVCGKRFNTKTIVARHIRHVHEKIRSHKCRICSKAFFKIEHLQAHVRLHTNDRPYKCEECGKAFAIIGYLKKHILVHGSKNFECQQCDMTFAKPEYLRNHMLTHTKEKRYPCAYCGVRFGRSDHRNRHEYTAHKKQRD